MFCFHRQLSMHRLRFANALGFFLVFVKISTRGARSEYRTESQICPLTMRGRFHPSLAVDGIRSHIDFRTCGDKSITIRE